MKILITGTSKGLGLKLANHFLAGGNEVFGCSRSKANIQHENYSHYRVDLTDPSGIKKMMGWVKSNSSSLDVLINNAATSNMNHLLLCPPETNKNIFNLNVLSLIDCSREATKLLRKSSSSVIINLSSVAVPWSLEGHLAYAASKSSVEMLTKVMSKELVELGIRVNCVGLPPLRTALSRTIPREKIKALIDRQVIKRQCKFEDVYGVIDFLTSPNSSFITGETIYLGGVL